MKNLIQGIVEFRKSLTPESRALFAKLALGQKPDALVIACSDSRVVPNQFASTNPGDLFFLRNIGNLIPPHSEQTQEFCARAALEFSIYSLNISDIVICGHSECAAIQALVDGLDHSCCTNLSIWLKHGQPSLDRVRGGFVLDPSLSFSNQISQVNVLQQMDHIKTYPFIRDRLRNNQLRVHGWWFDIAQADVYCYEENVRQFVLIDEDEAQRIMHRLQSPL